MIGQWPLPVRVCPRGSRSSGPSPRALFPGSFNPLHHGHQRLAHVAELVLQTPIEFELSIANVDKPDLPDDILQSRLEQFRDLAPIWVTRAPVFVQKAELFPEAVFVVGYDTAVRIISERYYSGSRQERDTALLRIADRGCRFLVGGRVDGQGEFQEWTETIMEQAGLPARLTELFQGLTATDFRVDISSTELRRKSSST